MAVYNIYHKDGSRLKDSNGKGITIHSIEYNGTWMGECFVTVTFENEAPINFSIGDYIEYRGERFEINYDPGKIKCASKDSYGGAFKYDSVKFNALSDELVRCDMLDLVLYDNQLHYTALPQFSFYVESLDDLLDRIQANLDELYGKATWKLYSRNKVRSVQRGGLESEWNSIYGSGTADNVIDSTSISISDQTCWDALSLVSSKFDINFIIRNRNVYVGTAGLPTGNIFKYGKNNGLYEIEQNSESDQMIITKLRAYGSNRNLPNSYYATLDAVPYAIADGFSESEGEGGYQLAIKIDKTKYEGAFTNVNYEVTEGFKECFVGCSIGGLSFSASVYMVKTTAGMSDNTLVITDKATAQEVKPLIGDNTRITFTSGANAHGFNGNRLDYSSSLPNNMACDRVMLPGFPKQSLREWWNSQSEAKKAWLNPGGKAHIFSDEVHRPYVTSLNVNKIGVRPASAFFDQDDKVNGIVDIYPTIEEMEVGGVRIDEIDTGTSVEDNGVFADVESSTIPNAVIYLKKEINFDINELKESDFSISMKDGMCAGRSFKIASCRKEKDGRWRLQVEREPDNSLGLYFPYNDFQIKKGDHFVLSGIKLPDAYVEAASEKLLKYCIAYLDRNDYTRYVYQPKVDEIFMARQHDKAMADPTGLTKSLYLTLKEGDIMLFKDDDLGIDGEVTIDQLTIKEEDGKIPTYEITLRDEKEVSAIQKIQNQIEHIQNGGVSGGMTSSQIKDIVGSVGSDRFISKINPDTAAGIITFMKGLVADGIITAKQGVEFGEYMTGLIGRGGKIDANGHGELRSLTLHEWLEVPEIRFNRITVNIGLSIRSEGGGIIQEVVPDVYEDGTFAPMGSAWLKLEDGEYGAIALNDLNMGIWHDFGGGNATENADDKKGTITKRGFKTVYFRITDIPATDPDGKDNSDHHFFRYALRSVEDGGNNSHPCAQMHFAQRGNTDDTERQGLLLSTTKYDIRLAGVNSWYFQDNQIYMIEGELEGFSMQQIGSDGNTYTKHFHGSGLVFGNAYMFGKMDEFERAGYRMEITRSGDGRITSASPENITIRIINAYGVNVTSRFTTFKLTRDSGDPEADAEWNKQHESVATEFTMSAAALGTMAYIQPILFTVTASAEGLQDVSASFTERLVSTEQLHIEFQPIEGKSYVVKASNVDTIVEARLFYGSEDITDTILLRSTTQMKWTRDSGIPTEDAAWTATTGETPNIIHIIDRINDRHDCGSYWMEKLKVIFAFECNIVFAIGEISMGASMQLGNS